MKTCEICKSACVERLPIIKIGGTSKYGVVIWTDITVCDDCKSSKTIKEICDVVLLK